MRLASALLVAATLSLTPALAQDLTAADVGPNVDRDFWCATAFSFTSYIAGQAGDAATAEADGAKMQSLFANIVQMMKAAGYQEAQFDGLNKQFAARVMNPFSLDSDGYTADVCNAASVEAEAAVAAAMAAAAAAEAEGGKVETPVTDAPAADPVKPAQ